MGGLHRRRREYGRLRTGGTVEVIDCLAVGVTVALLIDGFGRAIDWWYGRFIQIGLANFTFQC